MSFITKTVSSLTKVFPDEIKGKAISKASFFKNEPFSFQVAYKNCDKDIQNKRIFTRIESELDAKYISEYSVGYVPVVHPTLVGKETIGYDRITTGLFPDMLFKRTTNAEVLGEQGCKKIEYFEQEQKVHLNSAYETYQSLWFTINENSQIVPSGKYKISVVFCSAVDSQEIGRETIELNVLNYELPKQSLLYTCWFHCDCLADTYGVEIFSDKFFEIFSRFVKEATKNGMNMILLPAFTPPLDTCVGKTRKTTQLVKVKMKDGKYSFDFSLMEKYIKLCFECGITHFEHNHLFTQWGAKSAPQIMAEVEGENKQLFGWHTDSKSEEYKDFLKQYLKALFPFLDSVGVGKNILFHISDEPGVEDIEYYESAKTLLKNELKGYMCGDALNSFKYYKEGSVGIPIVDVWSNDIELFAKECDNYWVYYTGITGEKAFSNKLITTTGARNRIIGLQMYSNNAKGFLHWGYNYYYNSLSHGIFNPCVDPCGYKGMPAASFMVYPQYNGEAIPSLRMKIFNEGLLDYRACQLLESFTDKEKVKQLIFEFFDDTSYTLCPQNEKLFEFRQMLNNEILKFLK